MGENQPLIGIPIIVVEKKEKENIKKILLITIILLLPVSYIIGAGFSNIFKINFKSKVLENITCLVIGFVFIILTLFMFGIIHHYYHKFRYGVNLDSGEIMSPEEENI